LSSDAPKLIRRIARLKLQNYRRAGAVVSHSIGTKEEKHAAIRNTGLPVFEFLLGTGIRQFSTLYDECLGSRVSAG
jgi:hypothetical protein